MGTNKPVALIPNIGQNNHMPTQTEILVRATLAVHYLRRGNARAQGVLELLTEYSRDNRLAYAWR